MKCLRRISAIIISIVIMLSFSTSAMAHGHEKHDDILHDVLFHDKEHDMKTGKGYNDMITALNYASYLSIDQCNTQQGDEEKLKFLRNYGVSELPSSISQKEYRITEGGERHRRFTHRGWDVSRSGAYNPEEKEKWEYRKIILENTVDAVFGFNDKKTSNKQKEKRDSFCALIYYTHLLGDKDYDCNNNNYYEQRVIMELGGRTDKNDIIDELIYYLSILFKDQKNTSNYTYLMSELNEINSELKPVVSDISKLRDCNSEEFARYKECTEKTLALLTSENLSMLLKSEPFFNNAFYKHPYPEKRYV